jgi:hypothetical protein
MNEIAITIRDIFDKMLAKFPWEYKTLKKIGALLDTQ